MNDEEKAAEIQALTEEVESIVKYSHLPARNGEKAKTFTNIGAASSAVRARCRKIMELKGTFSSHTIKTASTSTTAMMKLAGIDLNKKAEDKADE